MITVIAPLAAGTAAGVRQLISTSLGNPAHADVRTALEGDSRFVHFVSLHALTAPDQSSEWLALEISCDGAADVALKTVAERLQSWLEPIFSQSSDWKSSDRLADFLSRHVVNVGTGYFDTVGLNFCGTPGQSVPDTLAEADLADHIGKLLTDQKAGLSPLERLADIRKSLAGDPEFAWALDPPPPPVPAPPEDTGSLLSRYGGLAFPFIRAFLWPLLLILIPVAIFLAIPGPLPWPFSQWVMVGVRLLFYVLVGILAAVAIAYFRFRAAEKSDWLSDRSPDPDELGGIFERENAPNCVQNHMLSATMLKPGLLRKITMRLAFWVVGSVTAKNPKPGHLGDIGTIHFARWVNVPGTPILLFFSNYGGSWESYLEDFITKAHQGLTAVWSNTTGFPRTSNLFLDGATDGERFKRYARQSMSYTPFWYSAYPDLTTDNIRVNRMIRRGVAAAMTQDEAVRWLALYGSRPRPVEKLEVTQIQSIVFGGLGFKPAGEMLLIELPAEVADARAWLADILPRVAFGDGRFLSAPAVLTLGASADALAKFGLPESAISTFPMAFVSGMTGPGRSRILGDTGRNAPENWKWGRSAQDVALLVYGRSRTAAGRLVREVERTCAAHGAAIVHRVALKDVKSDQSERKEPFGFVDGVSQPAIRGTYRGLRNDDPIHLVEPGELIVGYPDNRGHIPPGPRLDARYDPDELLPIEVQPGNFGMVTAEQPRSIGHNGSFLVIRQLEQDVRGFRSFCASEAKRLKDHFAELPVFCDGEFIAAKMIGRWRDGTSLVRQPYMSATRLRRLTGHTSTATVARSQTLPSSAVASPIASSRSRSQSKASGRAPQPDNDLLYGTEDPQGLRCPYGAHIRRANPRDSLSPGSQEQIDISNRHRILRVGRLYDEKVSAGLMFMCLNGDLERQFEFIQQTWMSSSKFHGLDSETDPIVTDGTKGRCSFTIPTRAGPVTLDQLPQFVTVRGGGYFFLPGRQLLDYLALPQREPGNE
jgi:Dyp-type peroxidase family